MSNNEDYRKGYRDGFKDGQNNWSQMPYTPPPTYPSFTPATGTRCNVCGMYFEHGKAYGYVCSNYGCPTRITLTNSDIAYSFGQFTMANATIIETK